MTFAVTFRGETIGTHDTYNAAAGRIADCVSEARPGTPEADDSNYSILNSEDAESARAFQVEGQDQYDVWTWMHVAGSQRDCTYATKEAAESAIESLVDTCEWDRDRLRIVEVQVGDLPEDVAGDIREERSAKPSWDSEGIWNAVFGPATPALVLAEVDTQSVTPQDYVRGCVDAAIQAGADFDAGEAFVSLCRQIGVEPG